jgi:hypothetical protein
LQEREEWLSNYVQKGDMPLMYVEFGTPVNISIMRGRSGFVNAYLKAKTGSRNSPPSISAMKRISWNRLIIASARQNFFRKTKLMDGLNP